MKSRIYFYIGILFLLILCVGACRQAGRWLVKEDDQIHADAIVMLMGSIAERVLHISDLYEKGLAGKVIIVEESMGAYEILKERGVNIISNTQQVSDAAITLGIPHDSIIVLAGNATSTQMEAVIIREYLANYPGIDTLLLVSSASHMRRASMIFKSAFRKVNMSVHVISSPSKYSGFNAERWWWRREDIQTVLMEYLKLVNFLLIDNRKLLPEHSGLKNRQVEKDRKS